MLERYDFINGKIVPTENSKAKVLIYIQPDETERSTLETVYGILRHSIESALDPDELGRMEKQGDHWAFIIKTPCNYTSEDQLLFTVTSIGLFLYKDLLIIIRQDALDLNDYRQIHSIKNVKEAFLAILYGTTFHFVSHIKVITMLSESLEKRISTSMENHFLLNMFSLEKSLVFFVNAISSNEVVIETLRENADKFKFTIAQMDILNEIYIENRQCDKQAEIYSNILTGLMDARGSVVNNNLSILIKRLTIVSVVFMPLNLLASMGGMSEFSSWTAHVPWWISYAFFLGFLACIGLISYRYLMITTSGVNTKKKIKTPFFLKLFHLKKSRVTM